MLNNQNKFEINRQVSEKFQKHEHEKTLAPELISKTEERAIWQNKILLKK